MPAYRPGRSGGAKYALTIHVLEDLPPPQRTGELCAPRLEKTGRWVISTLAIAGGVGLVWDVLSGGSSWASRTASERRSALECPRLAIGTIGPGAHSRAAGWSTVLDPRFVSHRVFGGSRQSPACLHYVQSYDEAETLEILLADTPASLEVRAFFTIFADRPVIARSARVRNVGSEPLKVECAMSAALDLPDSDWYLVHLMGHGPAVQGPHAPPWRPARSPSAA